MILLILFRSANSASSCKYTAQIFFSQRDRLPQNTLTDALPQPTFCHNIHFIAKQILQIHQKSTQVEEATPWLSIY